MTGLLGETVFVEYLAVLTISACDGQTGEQNSYNNIAVCWACELTIKQL